MNLSKLEECVIKWQSTVHTVSSNVNIAIWTDNDLDGAGSALALLQVYKNKVNTAHNFVGHRGPAEVLGAPQAKEILVQSHFNVTDKDVLCFFIRRLAQAFLFRLLVYLGIKALACNPEVIKAAEVGVIGTQALVEGDG